MMRSGAGFEWIRRGHGDEILLRQQRQSLNVPGQMIDSTGSSEYGGFPRSESQANQIVSGDFDASLSVGRDSHDAALSVLRRGNVEVAVDVESQSLWTSETAEEVANGTVAVDPINAIET